MTTVARLREKLNAFAFRQGFVDVLGWNATRRSSFERQVGGHPVRFTPIAEAGGFTVLEASCADAAGGAAITSTAASSLRQRIDNDLLAEMHAHILVFVNAERTEAVWHVSKQVRGRRIHRERRYYSGGPMEPLLRFLNSFEIPWDLLDRNGEVSHAALLDLLDSSNVFAERVSRAFYDQLKRKRDRFEQFLAWIEDEQQRSWYVTALLNRLMFIYFIQHKGMLGGDTRYLAHRLRESEAKGTDCFYREFLLPLCFFGFGRKQGERERFECQFREVPYLDGGLFELHKVEKDHGVSPEAVRDRTLPAAATVPDAEFKAWFEFFDSWRWTLDEDNPENEGEINPGILGYIFEKYINQKQMGAYYTKEDITSYICRNTILPRLFDMLAETGTKGRRAVEPLPIGPQPSLLNNGKGISQGEGIERYIYPAVKTADPLPTETDREYDARQARYQSILDDGETGKITAVNDFITYNLDIERMALDFVSTVQDAEVLQRFYFDCLRRITVLDPTCGSGAFLFAALKILYPLYNACLDRMKALCVCDVPPAGEPVTTMKGELAFANEVDAQQSMLDPDTVTDAARDAFAAELARIAGHPNRPYYVLKTIIVNNLYGVDIMDEAVEICKLRLFLKLIAHAERDDQKENWGIEPLPDIDFNVLAGNTLVGYTSTPDIDRHWKLAEYARADSTGSLLYEKDHSKLQVQIVNYNSVVSLYRSQQLGLELSRPRVTKAMVNEAAGLARHELNEDIWNLYRQAGMYLNPPARRQRDFLSSHRPFHWFLEFPNLTNSRGFDVCVGNPPYVEYSRRSSTTGKSIKDVYRVFGYNTSECDDLYAFTLERAYTALTCASGRHGFIVPVSVVSTFTPLRKCITESCSDAWHSSYAERPAKLFEGAEKRLTIVISRSGTGARIAGARYHRWSVDERPHLLNTLQYYRPAPTQAAGIAAWPKVGSPIEATILQKLTSTSSSIADFLVDDGNCTIFYTRKLRYFVQFFDFIPELRDGQGRHREPSELKTLAFATHQHARRALAALNSSLFFWFFCSLSDVRNVNRREIAAFPIDLGWEVDEGPGRLDELATNLMNSYQRHSELIRGNYRGVGTLTVQSFRPRMSKPEMDAIDRALAKQYGFTDEELDFIINYDTKYRMGRDAAAGEED